MFKAKLIENPRYYKLIRYQLLFFILIFIPYTVIIEYLGVSERWSLVLLIMFLPILGGLIYIFFTKPFNRCISRKILEIEDYHIRIVNFNGLDITEWDVNEADTIVTSKDYYLPNDEHISWLNKVRRPPHHNFLEIKKGKQKSRFEFHLDSHYMALQIKKAVDNWVAKGIPVKRI